MQTQNMAILKYFIRALRLPFVTASILPFILGSLLVARNFNLVRFLFGLAAVVSTHLCLNLFNDYADSKSGADWYDIRFYGFFGGSKLIQERVFSEKFYLHTAFAFLALAWLCVVRLAFILSAPMIIVFYAGIILLGWSYSGGPFKLSYRCLGELAVFILFGPVLVMGGYYVQTGIFPTWRGFLLSCPCGFLTSAILFANEVPDLSQDKQAGKFTLAGVIGPGNAYRLYYLLISLGFLFVALNVSVGYLKPYALISLALFFPAAKAAKILKRHPRDKSRLTESSRLTIAVQSMAVLAIIIFLNT